MFNILSIWLHISLAWQVDAGDSAQDIKLTYELIHQIEYAHHTNAIYLNMQVCSMVNYHQYSKYDVLLYPHIEI